MNADALDSNASGHASVAGCFQRERERERESMRERAAREPRILKKQHLNRINVWKLKIATASAIMKFANSTWLIPFPTATASSTSASVWKKDTLRCARGCIVSAAFPLGSDI